ncbi:redoxin domain-containing protein [Flammeovirga agarivorans]|uniref:AhpC/TSA family protein n=1 Tax=Flammeovirga agarivorans TaxID=2726742 RepID=A0A7X8SJG5_9BACT|nr:TlpA disulfide reductase family protein [Flammeovirga agarivorans]NLR91346.1 AhpC/TSA family protein [Flammeovirga agarivorans]
MKTFKYSLILLLALFAISCGSSKENDTKAEYPAKISISGQLEGIEKGAKVILYSIENVGGKRNVAETTVDEKGKFSFDYTVPKIGLYTINIDNQAEEILVLEDKDLSVSSAPVGYEISGSRENELLHGLKEMYDKYSEEGSKLQQEYASSENKEEVIKKIKAMQDAQKAELQQKLKKFDGAYVSLVVLNFLNDKEAYFDVINETVEKLEKNFPDDQLVKEVSKSIDAIKATRIGAMATEINLPSVEGKNIALSDFKGNYVMIDFWASWCRPCRMENPNVLRAYNKYKSKGFEVYGVSIDQDQNAWKQAIQIDHISWTQVHDTNNEAAKAYGVESIPFTLLLDKEGKIIAKNLRGNALEEKLEELLGK